MTAPAYRKLMGAVGLTALLTWGLASSSSAQGAGPVTTKPSPSRTTLPNSYTGAPSGAQPVGPYSASQVTTEVVLTPNNAKALQGELTSLYTAGSPNYHRWLAKGQFDARYSPTAAERAKVTAFLRSAGLTVSAGSSPFLLRATGTSSQIQAAFDTQLTRYRASNGTTFMANSSAVSVPSSTASAIQGVLGLSTTAKAHPEYQRPPVIGSTKPAAPAYGAGVDGSGLTPSQLHGIYNAPTALGPRAEGKGVTAAVFELSGYRSSDITTWTHQYLGSTYKAPLKNINVDGGPITPKCPSGDVCNPPGDYSGDIEVDADIETLLGQDPDLTQLDVYNAPNDETGLTIVDEYNRIAQDDTASVISTSWGECEQDEGIGAAEAEFLAFEQMALQGQSIFAAAGDTGAFDCLEDTGSPNMTDVAVDDPASQPLVTGVGGTSFESFDPQSNPHPTYPTGFETVWNVLGLCNASGSGLQECLAVGAGGGGVSRFWQQPFFQMAPGTVNANSKKAPFCSEAAKGSFCREVPDVSANADEFTPYSEYCTGNPNTNSTCATISPSWFGVGGTSLATPLWASIIAAWDSDHGDARFGEAAATLYTLDRVDPGAFHDITGRERLEDNNGLYPATPGYDLATGLGSPNIAAIVESKI